MYRQKSALAPAQREQVMNAHEQYTSASNFAVHGEFAYSMSLYFPAGPPAGTGIHWSDVGPHCRWPTDEALYHIDSRYICWAKVASLIHNIVSDVISLVPK